MRPRAHRRDQVEWSPFAGLARPDGTPRLARPPRAWRLRSGIRTGALLTAIGLMRLARAVRRRSRPLVAGSVLTAAGLLLRSGGGAMILLPGLLLLFSAPFTPAGPDADSKRRSELEREFAVHATAAQRRDLAAILDRHPDDITGELRDILAGQAIAAAGSGISEAGRFARHGRA
jgi:hypothetical protein